MNNQPPVDFSAYQTPLSWSAVVRQALGTRGRNVGLGALFSVAFILLILFISLVQNDNPFSLLLVFLLIVVPNVLALRLLFWRSLARSKQALLLHQFAVNNGFQYMPSIPAREYPGLLFAEANIGSTYNTVVSGTYCGLPFTFGNAEFETGSGRSRHTSYYGVICVRLARAVPHVLLDNKKNNRWGMSNFTSLKRAQRLQLEGDFNRYFDLYVPQGYERDVLYFLTPELMALLIDESGDIYDVEAVDDYLFIYSSKPFALERAQGVQRVLALICSIGGEFQENTARYADERIGYRAANMIAAPGRRLKKSWPWMIIIIVAIYLIAMLLN